MERKRFLKYSLLLGGLSFFKTSRLFAFYTQSQKFFLNKVKFIWAGSITTQSVKVKVKLSTATTSARLVVGTDQSLSSPVFGNFSTADAANNFVAEVSIGGLFPNTEYYYGIEADGVIDTTVDAIGRFKTFQSAAHSFRFSIASCNSNGNHPVFNRIKEKDPLFHITHGDFHYGNPNSATDKNVHRLPFEDTLGQLAIRDFLRNNAIAYMWDDHDYCGDNTNSLAIGRTNARLVYQEYVPHYPLAAGSGDVPIYQSFTVGRVRFILSDLRSERTAVGTSMMGTAQKAWFKNECLAAKNIGHVIVWISSVPWGGTLDTDTWAGFTSERTELSDFFRASGIQNLLVICGDAHMIAIDNGTNHDYSTGGNNLFKYPVLQAAAVNQVGSFRGGTYSEGFFINPSQLHGQYAVVDITDNGGSSIGVSIKGHRVASDGSESVLINYSFNWPVLSVLPITILKFAAKKQGRKTLLSWEMAYTPNARYKKMQVERSDDGLQFTSINSIDRNPLLNVIQHSFIDELPLSGTNYYRIKVIDENDKITYSAIELVSFDKELMVDILNNPSKDRLQLSIRTPVAEMASYTIADAAGRTVIKGSFQLNAGENRTSIDVQLLANGIHFLMLILNGSHVSKKFVRS